MSDYTAPMKDMDFILNELSDHDTLMNIPDLSEFSPDLVSAVLEEAGKFAKGVLAPLNQTGDIEGCTFADGKVSTPTGWKNAYDQFCENGWLGLSLPETYGGQELPKFISMAVNEMWLSANLAFVMFQTLNQGACEILLNAGTDKLKERYLEKLVTGQWTSAMALTEPNAGSDLGSIKTKATPRGEGEYSIKGQKIFITYGEHDLCENIAHLVLAKTPGAPDGAKGISLFIVPKFKINDDGSLGEHNDVHCVSIEHKTGLHGSPTCALSYGDNDNCIGTLIGEENKGLQYMFILMNEARLSTGLQGVAFGELSYQKSLEYAFDRTQGRDAITGEQNVAIVQHPDVKRMLLGLRAQTMSLRALGYLIASRIDQAHFRAESPFYKDNNDFVALLTPVFKAFSTESGNLMAGSAIQIFGGMGFIEETGVAQLMRDIRITTIYEGTTGIQANDLLFRKIASDQGDCLSRLLQEIRFDAQNLSACPEFSDEKETLLNACDMLQASANYIVEHTKDAKETLLAGAVPFLEMMGIVCCSWQMAKIAAKAQDKIANDQDPEYHANLCALSKFYFAHYTPRATSLNETFLKAQQGLKDYHFANA